MHIEQKDNYILLTNTSDNFDDFFSNFELKHPELKENNIFIHFSEGINTSEKEISLFLKYAEQQQSNGITFVVIQNNIDVDNFPEWFNITPTLQEAEDVLEMEDIQRDLGF